MLHRNTCFQPAPVDDELFFCVVVDHVRVCYHSTSMPYTLGSTVFCLCFSSLSMQVMNFKLKGGSKLLTHVCMQISVCQESARCCICEQIRFGSHKEREAMIMSLIPPPDPIPIFIISNFPLLFHCFVRDWIAHFFVLPRPDDMREIQ